MKGSFSTKIPKVHKIPVAKIKVPKITVVKLPARKLFKAPKVKLKAPKVPGLLRKALLLKVGV